MRVDFYQLSQTPVEGALPQLAGKMREAGARVLVVSADDTQLARISDALWAVKADFLAHAPAGGPHDSRQPILLSDNLANPNGATAQATGGGSSVNFSVVADRVGTFGQVGAGVNFKVHSFDMVGFLRGDLLFGNNITGASFNIGLRKQF